jgi:hypothetical protein
MTGSDIANTSKTMGSWEALWAVIGGLVLAGAVGLAGPAWLALTVVVAYFAGGALYWKVRLRRQRTRRRR